MATPNPETLEHLIDALVDGEGSDAEFARFDRLAADSAIAWRDLATELHLARRLESDAGAALDRAEAVELDASRSSREAGGPLPVSFRVTKFAGWAVAAALAVALVVSQKPQPVAPAPATTQASLAPSEALEQYLEAPHVLGQLEPRLVRSSTTSDGAEVVYIRSIIERARVDEVYEPSWYDGSNLILKPADTSQVIRASY
ncbi:MAG: hypothetical protein ACF8PN_15035 [Phycisphaerales bacterium]